MIDNLKTDDGNLMAIRSQNRVEGVRSKMGLYSFISTESDPQLLGIDFFLPESDLFILKGNSHGQKPLCFF